MNASEAKERVLAVYPEAHVAMVMRASGWSYQVRVTGVGISLGWDDSEDAAWIDAASSLPEEKEPAPKKCGTCGDPCIRHDKYGWLHVDMRTYNHNAVPVNAEPAPKEGEKCRWCGVSIYQGGYERWYHKGTAVTHCDRVAEPAKVEAGDALPPLDKEWEVEVQVQGLMRDGRDDMARTRAVLHCRERQLKASLLRENGQKEEIERLKGLLRRTYLSTVTTHDSGHVKVFMERELFKEIETTYLEAVESGEFSFFTGEQP